MVVPTTSQTSSRCADGVIAKKAREKSILGQDSLLVALARKDHPPVKLLLSDGQAKKISAVLALRMVRATDHQGGGTGTRVRWIKVIPAAPWAHCYRTAEAPVVQPSIEWLNSRLSGRA